MIWSKQEDERLVTLRALGYPFSQIVLLMKHRFGDKFTKNSCIGRYHRIMK